MEMFGMCVISWSVFDITISYLFLPNCSQLKTENIKKSYTKMTLAISPGTSPSFIVGYVYSQGSIDGMHFWPRNNPPTLGHTTKPHEKMKVFFFENLQFIWVVKKKLKMKVSRARTLPWNLGKLFSFFLQKYCIIPDPVERAIGWVIGYHQVTNQHVKIF